MRKLLFALPIILLASCGSENSNNSTENSEAMGADATASKVQEMSMYGDTISTEGAMAPADFLAQLEGKDTLKTKLEATINQTCKMKGCWMTLDMENGEQMRVSFKDYGFFVPKEGVEGKKAIVEGFAFTDTISVDHLKHLAEDEGKSPEEIAAINEPEIGVNFEAHGVIIRN
ncbi:MAG: DUF4920 domain-containing protein [Cryomorphaceae bacterium]